MRRYSCQNANDFPFALSNLMAYVRAKRWRKNPSTCEEWWPPMTWPCRLQKQMHKSKANRWRNTQNFDSLVAGSKVTSQQSTDMHEQPKSEAARSSHGPNAENSLHHKNHYKESNHAVLLTHLQVSQLMARVLKRNCVCLGMMIIAIVFASMHPCSGTSRELKQFAGSPTSVSTASRLVAWDEERYETLERLKQKLPAGSSNRGPGH